MKKLLKRFVNFFRKPKKRVLSLTEYDKLLDSKLNGIRNFIRIAINVRDDDKEFNKQFEEAFLMYENAVKAEMKEKGKTIEKNPEIFLSPYLNDLFGLTQRLSTSKIKRKILLHKRIKWFFKRLVFKIKLYWKHIKLMREIRKMKKIMGGRIDNQRAYNLIQAANLNKRMLEKEQFVV